MNIVEVLAEIPDRLNLRKQVSRIRLANMPANPLRLTDLEGILDTYRTTLGGDRFLLYDSFEDEDFDEDENDCGRVIIFSTQENLRQLFKCDIWFVDGTFKTAPSLFFQVFSILGAVHQVGINRKPQTTGLPSVHALLQNKQQSAYKKVFETTLEAGRELGLVATPTYIMSDFEMAIINSAQYVFGEDKVKCCFFHLSQSIYRHIVAKGLQTLYNSDDRRIKKGAHMLCALAFVPADKVAAYFQEIRDELPDELEPIADYFEVNYVGRLNVRRRTGGIRIVSHPPRYPPKLWAQYGSVIDGTARTNNLSEGWHNRFQVVVGKNHPSLYTFFNEMQKEQADTEIMLRQLQLGQRIRRGVDKKRRLYEDQ